MKLGERTGQLWRDNSRRVRTHKKNSREAVRRLGTIIQSIFCAQSGTSILLTVWKWSGESRYPAAFPPLLENFCRAFSPGPTDRPWVSEDELPRKLATTKKTLFEARKSDRIENNENESTQQYRSWSVKLQILFYTLRWDHDIGGRHGKYMKCANIITFSFA